MALPEWPPGIRSKLIEMDVSELFRWWQQFKSFMNTTLSTQGDVTLETAAKGIIMTSSSGLKKRARLNATGDGFIFEDV